MAEVTVAVLVFVTSWLLLWLRRINGKSSNGLKLPPCLPTLPLVGSVPFVPLDPDIVHKFFLQKTSKYGSVFGFYVGLSYVVVLNDANAINEALLKRSTDFANRPTLSIEVTYYNTKRNGIIFANYDSNYRRKHQLYLSILKQFGFGQRIMENRINVEVADVIDQLRLTKEQPFDPFPILAGSVVNVIGSILFGRRFERGSDRQVELLDRVHQAMNTYAMPVHLFPVLRFVPYFRKQLEKQISVNHKMFDFLKREIGETLAEIDSGSAVDSFVSLYTAASSASTATSSLTGSRNNDTDKPTSDERSSEKANETFLDQDELLFTIRDLTLAGTDTSVQTLRWAMVELANHPQVQHRLQQEIDRVVGRDRLPSLADEADMPYVQAVILELMRRRTLVPRALLHQTRCDTRVGDWFLPARTIVIANLYCAHMNPKVWAEPEQFRPERFLNDKGQIIDKERVMPFSLGKRSCTGELLARQEVFLFVTGLFQNYTFLPPEKEKQIVVEEKVCASVNNASPFCVRAIPRH